jgi:hypothetical protein
LIPKTVPELIRNRAGYLYWGGVKVEHFFRAPILKSNGEKATSRLTLLNWLKSYKLPSGSALPASKRQLFYKKKRLQT